MTWSRILVLFAIATFANAAHADLFRCTGPDGKTVYTDKKQTCPGAEPSEPAGVVHRAETPEAAGTSAPAARAGGPETPDAEAEREKLWRQKKVDAARELDRISKRREAVDQAADHCSRPGRHVVTRDDAGIKQVVSCSELKRNLEALEQREAAARQYLDTGLPEECRRAGCLPGWLR
jgi:Domain of unknown function (DUF4124)